MDTKPTREKMIDVLRSKPEVWNRWRRMMYSHPNLVRANLVGADLSEVDLSEVNLSGANLRGAAPSGADLTRSLLGARGRGDQPHRVPARHDAVAVIELDEHAIAAAPRHDATALVLTFVAPASASGCRQA